MTGQPDAKILSPELNLLVKLITEGKAVMATACSRRPFRVAEIKAYALGVGWVDVNGGTITITRRGTIRCIAYDVDGKVAVTTPQACPVGVRGGQRVAVRSLVTK